MSGFLWAGCGATMICSVVFLALGLHRPRVWKHIYFGILMAVVSIYFALQNQFYNSQEMTTSVEILRLQVMVVVAVFVSYFLFLREYAHWKPSKSTVAGLAVVLSTVLVYNYFSPFTVMFASSPTVVSSAAVGGESINLLSAPANAPMLLWYGFHFVFVISVLLILRRLCPEKRLMMVGVLIVFLTIVADLARDSMDGSWPYVGEFGVAAMAVLMTLEMAIDFRRNESHLERAIGASQMVRDQLNTPLQTLNLGLELIEPRTADEKVHLSRLKSSVARLDALGRLLQRESLFK